MVNNTLKRNFVHKHENMSVEEISGTYNKDRGKSQSKLVQNDTLSCVCAYELKEYLNDQSQPE